MWFNAFRPSFRVGVLASALLGTAFTAGCGQSARVVTSDTDLITTVDQIDPQDWKNAVAQMASSVAQSPALLNLNRTPAHLKVSRITNSTRQHLDPDLLTFDLVNALRDTGKIVAVVEDQAAKEYSAQQRFLDDQPVSNTPDFTLSGKIIELNARADRLRQSTFVFQVSLNDIRSGTQVWAKQVNISKQGTRPGVGF